MALWPCRGKVIRFLKRAFATLRPASGFSLIEVLIATLLLMVLAVSAGVVIYAYVMGYLGGFGSPTTMGGISVDTLPKVLNAGANAFVAAHAIFKHPDGIAGGIRALREKC
jgi:hypothetical protein